MSSSAKFLKSSRIMGLYFVYPYRGSRDICSFRATYCANSEYFRSSWSFAPLPSGTRVRGQGVQFGMSATSLDVKECRMSVCVSRPLLFPMADQSRNWLFMMYHEPRLIRRNSACCCVLSVVLYWCVACGPSVKVLCLSNSRRNTFV